MSNNVPEREDGISRGINIKTSKFVKKEKRNV